MIGGIQRAFDHGLGLLLRGIHGRVCLVQGILCCGTSLFTRLGQCSVGLRQCIACHVVGGIAGIVQCGICLLQRALRRIAGLGNGLLRGFLRFGNCAISRTCGSRSRIGDSSLRLSNRALCGIGRLLCGGIGRLLRLLHSSASSRADVR